MVGTQLTCCTLVSLMTFSKNNYNINTIENDLRERGENHFTHRIDRITTQPLPRSIRLGHSGFLSYSQVT